MRQLHRRIDLEFGRRTAQALILCAVALPPAALAGQDPGRPVVGQPAPVVVVKDLDGRGYDLATVIGRQPVFIQFWASWCEQCKALLPKLRAAAATYGGAVEFIGINIAVGETPARIRSYLEQHHPPFRVLYDTEGMSQRAFEVPTTSYVVIVDAQGRIAYTGYGSAQRYDSVLARVTKELP